MSETAIIVLTWGGLTVALVIGVVGYAAMRGAFDGFPHPRWWSGR